MIQGRLGEVSALAVQQKLCGRYAVADLHSMPSKIKVDRKVKRWPIQECPQIWRVSNVHVSAAHVHQKRRELQLVSVPSWRNSYLMLAGLMRQDILKQSHAKLIRPVLRQMV
jgi:hypothetical protein